MAGRIEMTLAELGITLPSPMPPIANYVPYAVTGSLVVVSGQVPAVDGKIAVTGKVGGAPLLHQCAGASEGRVWR
jgi:enamine deaminase RidA (YjgF/YER057c/UK114 family)